MIILVFRRKKLRRKLWLTKKTFFSHEKGAQTPQKKCLCIINPTPSMHLLTVT